MYQKKFGKRNKLKFSSPREYYETLGFLAKSDRLVSFHWEQNEEQGAWGSEGRIHCYSSLSKFPIPLRNKFTKGRGGVLRRINCNEFVQDLIKNHSFKLFLRTQNANSIRLTIPEEYITDFDKGLNF